MGRISVSQSDKSETRPYFDYHVFVCTNERPENDPRGCCKHKGSVELQRHMKTQAKALGLRRVRINSAGCLDRCAFGPTLVIYPEGVWYKAETTAEIDEILHRHLVEGGRVERLMLPERRARISDAEPASGSGPVSGET